MSMGFSAPSWIEVIAYWPRKSSATRYGGAVVFGYRLLHDHTT
jgi:hypothetical protein